MSFRRILDGGRQLEPVAEARQELAGAEDLHAGRSQLDRQRQRIERAAESDDVGHVLRRKLEVALRGLRASDEERDGRRRARRVLAVPLGQSQGADRELMLTR